ncbi:MAG: hypothetical protein ACI8S6_001425 [Myxococcota bacterium]|jgi:hypothetical protein
MSYRIASLLLALSLVGCDLIEQKQDAAPALEKAAPLTSAERQPEVPQLVVIELAEEVAVAVAAAEPEQLRTPGINPKLTSKAATVLARTQQREAEGRSGMPTAAGTSSARPGMPTADSVGGRAGMPLATTPGAQRGGGALGAGVSGLRSGTEGETPGVASPRAGMPTRAGVAAAATQAEVEEAPATVRPRVLRAGQ